MFLPAFCAAVAVGALSLYVMESMAEAAAAKVAHSSDEIYARRHLPPLLRLGLPGSRLFLRLAAREVFGGRRKYLAMKLAQAGFTDTITEQEMLALEMFFLAAGFFFLILGMINGSVILCLLIGILLMIYPALWMRTVIKKRHLEILKALPNVLDLLTLSVESGKDLVSSLRDILGRRRNDPLSEELYRAFQEIQLGVPRREALRSLADRVGQSDLTATMNAIVQAEELGVSIAQLLRIQSDMQRGKRFSRAEELANQAAVKILIPVVIFILPAVFIMLLGPLALQTAKLFR